MYLWDCTLFPKYPLLPPSLKLFVALAMPGLSYGMWTLGPQPGIEPQAPALGVQSLSHWTTREVPVAPFSAHKVATPFPIPWQPPSMVPGTGAVPVPGWLGPSHAAFGLALV